MTKLFDLCVLALELLASLTGLTYKEINIWIFVIIEPFVFLSMLIYILKLRKHVRDHRQIKIAKAPSGEVG